MQNIQKFDILITLTSHLHIGSADKSQKVDPDTGYFGADGFPVARTQHIRMPLTANDTDDSSNARFREFPWIPPFSIRGYLRRKIAAEVKSRILQRKEMLKFDTYHALMCGARTAAPEGTENAQEMLERMQHPIVGLVGGGPKMIRSHMTISAGIPVTQDTVAASLVPDAYLEYGVSKTKYLTQPLCFRRVDDVLTGSDTQMVAVIDDFQKSLADWLSSNASNKQARNADRVNKERGEDRTKKSDLMSFQFIEGILPGVTFYGSHRIDLSGPGLAGLGLYLKAVEAMAVEQRLGGKVAAGFGQFNLRLVHRSDGSNVECLLREITSEAPKLNMSYELIRNAVTEWDNFEVKAADLDTLFS